MKVATFSSSSSDCKRNVFEFKVIDLVDYVYINIKKENLQLKTLDEPSYWTLSDFQTSPMNEQGIDILSWINMLVLILML